MRLKLPILTVDASGYWLWYGGLFLVGSSFHAPVSQQLTESLFWAYLIFFFFGAFLIRHSPVKESQLLLVVMLSVLFFSEPSIFNKLGLLTFSFWLFSEKWLIKKVPFYPMILVISPLIYILPLIIGLRPSIRDFVGLSSLYAFSCGIYLFASVSQVNYLKSIGVHQWKMIVASAGLLTSIPCFYMLTQSRGLPWSMFLFTYPSISLMLLAKDQNYRSKLITLVPIVNLFLGISVYLLSNLTKVL